MKLVSVLSRLAFFSAFGFSVFAQASPVTYDNLICELSNRKGSAAETTTFYVSLISDTNAHGDFHGVGYDIQTFIERHDGGGLQLMMKQYFVTLTDASKISAYSSNAIFLPDSGVVDGATMAPADATVSLAHPYAETTKLTCTPVANFSR